MCNDSVRFVVAALLLTFAHLPAAAPAPDPVFNYDASQPFQSQQHDKKVTKEISILDLSFVPLDKPVKAFMVKPISAKPLSPAVLFIHWYGDPATSNRTQFLSEAVDLAHQGVVSLLIEAMWAEPGWYKNRVPENDFDMSVRQVIELRRAMDWLLAQPEVDKKRVALVAHDFGAMYGVIAESLAPRARTYILMAPTSRFIDWFLFASQPKNRDTYETNLSTLDPLNYLSRLAPAPVFFQFGATDEYVSAGEALDLYTATLPRKQMVTYKVGHDLNTPDAREDRLNWLLREFGISQGQTD